MKKVYRDLMLAENVKYRRILNEGASDECTWHRDAKDRIVQIVEGQGWKIQFDNQLPVTVRPGDRIRILAQEWHRVIPGKGDLLMIIKEEVTTGDELDIAGIDASDPRFIEDEDAWVGENGTRDANQLALALAETAAALTQHCFITLFQTCNKLVGVSGLGSGFDLGIAGV